MATATSKTNTFIPDFEAATERAREANERFAQAGRTITGAYLDGLEKYVDGVAQFERRLGEQAKIEAVSELLNAHAQMSQDLAKAGVRVARELIAV
ncbi:MAG TPA: hypothetical protein VF781_12320 [Solirubrobacteraceae bacterium]